MINSYLVIKKNNVLLHYKNEFDIQPIKVITPSFPLWRGQGEVKKETNKNYSSPFPLWRGQGEVKRQTNKNYSYPFPFGGGRERSKEKPNKSYNHPIPLLEGAGGGQKRTTNAKYYTL